MAENSLFDVLKQIGRKDHFLHSKLTQKEQQQFNPVMLLKWGIGSKLPILNQQEVNNHFFQQPAYLQYALLATIPTPKTNVFWKWREAPKQPQHQDAVRAIQIAYDLDASTAKSVIPLFTECELVDLIETYGDTSDDKPKTSKKKSKKG